MEDSRSREQECDGRRIDPRECGYISKDEIKEALRKMSNGKVEGPDQIPVEVFGRGGIRVTNGAFQCYF